MIKTGFNQVNESSKSKRSKDIEKLMTDIDTIWNRSGVDDSDMEQILSKNHANEDDSGDEGYFTGMSDSDIKKAWKDIQKKLQDNYSKGREMDSELIKIFHLVNKMTKAEFSKKLDKIRAKDNAYSQGYCDAVEDLISAYKIKL